MKISTNTLIAIVVIGVGGVILYQLLLNFIFPIALFVLLLYVLKYLIKGFENNDEIEGVPILEDQPGSPPTQNVVPITPVVFSSNNDVSPEKEETPQKKDKSLQDN